MQHDGVAFEEAACTAAEGEHRHALLRKRVVETALAVAARPVAHAELTPAALLHVVVRESVHLRLLLRRRSRIELALGDALVEVASFKDVELIEVRAVDARGDEIVEILLPDLHRLTGQTEDEVEHDRALLVRLQKFEPFEDFLPRLDPALRLTHLRIEGLHAERDAVDAVREPRLDLLGHEVMDAAFERQLVIICQGQDAAERREDARGVFRRKRRRRAAADEDGVYEAALEARRVRSRLDLLDQSLDVVVLRRLMRGILEKAAVEALRLAERDVNVRRLHLALLRGRVHDVEPRLLRLSGRHDLAAHACMNDALSRERFRQRVVRRPAELQLALFLGIGSEHIFQFISHYASPHEIFAIVSSANFFAAARSASSGCVAAWA